MFGLFILNEISIQGRHVDGALSMTDNQEFGELKATVASIGTRLDETRQDLRSGFDRLEIALKDSTKKTDQRLDSHGVRLKSLELWRNGIAWVAATLAIIWAGVKFAWENIPRR